MDAFLALFLMFSAAGVGVGALVWRDRSWRRVGQDYGLHYDSKGVFGERRLTGQVHGVSVQVSAEHTGKEEDKDGSEAGARVTVFRAGNGEIPPTVSAHLEGGFAQLVNRFVSTDVKIGDAPLDRRLRLEGDDVELAAIMSRPGRAGLRELLERHDGTLESGHLGSRKTGWMIRERKLREHLDRVLGVATELAADQEALPARLRHNALNDPVEGVRDNCAALVMHRYPDTPEARDVATARKNSPDAELAMLAALVLGEADAVLEMVADRRRDTQARALGAHHLARVDRQRGLALVRELLAGKPGPLWTGACRGVLDYALTEALPELNATVSRAREMDGPTILAIALAYGGPAEAPAAAWVFDKCGNRLPEAVEFVRSHGDFRAIEPLAAMSKGALRAWNVKEAARTLHEELRGRLDLHNRSGGLSVVEEDQGGLSVAPEDQGGLSVASAGDGGLSLDGDAKRREDERVVPAVSAQDQHAQETETA